MTTEEALANLQRQNDVIIALLARLVWTPEKIADTVTRGKRNPSAYLKVYNSLDGVITGKALASMAKVTPPAISYLLKTWEEQGIITNLGTPTQPKYKRLMSIPTATRKQGNTGTNADRQRRRTSSNRIQTRPDAPASSTRDDERG
jgi:hypothetical protein